MKHHYFKRVILEARPLRNTENIAINCSDTSPFTFRLTNPPSQIPSEMLSDSKCNEFPSFFSEKISNIRKEIGTSSSYAEVTQIRPQSQKEVTMSVFEAIDSKILEEIVQHLISSTCYLDSLPTSHRTDVDQDGAEHGSHVASSEKTLQVFVCFVCLFVVLRVRCC